MILNLFEIQLYIFISNWEQACWNAGAQVSHLSQRVKTNIIVSEAVCHIMQE